KQLRLENWQVQQNQGVDLIPSNDFSLYDQVLDTSILVSAIPKRFREFVAREQPATEDLYFALARGYQQGGYDLTALEMTKWFDTNYHYIVPEFYADQKFELQSNKVIDEYKEAQEAGIATKPVILGPIS